MEDRNQQQRIMQHLQSAEVQQRILRDMQRAREEATVTISDAAGLFDFTEFKLRDWEKTGLLSPQRRVQDTEQDGKGAKRRQYTTAELDKLAIIRELIQQGKFSPSSIPPNIDEIWTAVVDDMQQKSRLPEVERKNEKHVHIDQRVERTEKEEFWRYFVSQALRLSLLLICEDVPDTVAGIILPLEKDNVAEIVITPNDIHKAGYSLVGWLSQSRSFYTFLDPGPTFEHPSDFRVEPLTNLVGDYSAKQEPQNNILVIVQRKAKTLILSKKAAKTIQRMLDLVYETVDQWRPSFESDVRDWMYRVTDFANSSAVSDEILNGLTDIVVRLGGKTENGQNRWRFCCILTPGISLNNSILPRQQHRLIVRAQSSDPNDSPHKIGVTYVTPDKTVIALSLRAYLSGQTVYRPVVVGEDETIALREIEGKIGSAIAIPVEDEDGLTMAVMYVVSREEETEAFPEDDRRLLRMVGRIVITYHNRQQRTSISKKIIEKPDIADIIVGNFYSENKFIKDLETVLSAVRKFQPLEETELGEKELSFISLDIDGQSSLGSMLGDRVTRNLSWELGERLYVQLKKLFGIRADWHFYYIFGGRFYIILDKMSQKVAGESAELLREALRGEYKVDALRTTLDEPTSPVNMLKLPDITIRFGVTSYKYWKLTLLLQRYADAFPETNVSFLIRRFLDIALYECEKDSIVVWNRIERKFKIWPFQE